MVNEGGVEIDTQLRVADLWISCHVQSQSTRNNTIDFLCDFH